MILDFELVNTGSGMHLSVVSAPEAGSPVTDEEGSAGSGRSDVAATILK